MEPHTTWTGWIAGLIDGIVDDNGPSGLAETLFGFYRDSGCCALGSQKIGAHFPEADGIAVECHVAECVEGPRIVSELMKCGPRSVDVRTRMLIDELARAVSRTMRQKAGIDG